jgi:hypothetical protein
MNWREWFAKARTISWQGMDIPANRLADFEAVEPPNSTEAMYQAFKARLLDETNLVSKQ